jgi:hypothetical protein
MCSSVKVIPSDHKKFEIITTDTHFEFTAETEKEFLMWTALIEVIINFFSLCLVVRMRVRI